ncbi:MAG TPA: glycosyltransferase [Burkholderiales bacterium]|nr:glycosyltransferase [Burkholderiales bacterium]
MTDARPRHFVFYLSSEWRRFHRPGMIAAMARRAAGEGGKVLIVDQPVCRVTTRIKHRERWRRWQAQPGALDELGGNLYRYDASVFLHDKLAACIPGVAYANRGLLQGQVARALGRLGMSPEATVSWFYFPTFHQYVGMLGEALAIYECYDEHSEIPGLWRTTQRRYRVLERALCGKVDGVFVTSNPLLEAKRTLHPRVFLSHNAADAAFYSRVPVLPDATARRESGRPVVGYVGTIHEHTDLALLRRAAEQRPDWSFVICGSVQRGADRHELERLMALPNTSITGWVDDDALLSVMSDFDVGIIPYRSDAAFNRYVNPNKLHEYVAMGKPVVTTRFGDLSTHAEFTLVADDAAQFVAAIEHAYRTDTPDKAAARRCAAALNSWDARAAGIFTRLDALWSEKHARRH